MKLFASSAARLDPAHAEQLEQNSGWTEDKDSSALSHVVEETRAYP